MNTKIIYTTTAGKTFHTIAVNCEPTEAAVNSFMNRHYNMAGITGYSFKPSVKTGYKKVCNYQPK